MSKEKTENKAPTPPPVSSATRVWNWLRREGELVLLVAIGGIAYVALLIGLALTLAHGHLAKDAIDGATKIAASFGAIVAGGWVAVTYLNNKRLEVRERFNELQLETILFAAKTAGDLVATTKPEDWGVAVAEFWKLYWGKLVIFEDDLVVTAMVNLGTALPGVSFERRNDLAQLAYELSRALRDHLKTRNDNEWKLFLGATHYDKFDLTEKSRQSKGKLLPPG